MLSLLISCDDDRGSLTKRRMHMRNRQEQRELHRKQTREKMIDKSNYCGVKDLTAYNAVMQIRTNGKANIVLK